MRGLRNDVQTGGHTCPWWFGYSFDNPVRGLMHKPRHLFRGFLKTGDTVADIGCGGGHFSLGLAERVGAEGRVIAIDLQEKMLERVRRRAVRRGLEGVIELRQCTERELGLNPEIDFALAFWMVHEVSDQARFFAEVRSALKPSGCLFVAEPKVHVTVTAFEKMMAVAKGAGLTSVSRPRVRLSRAVLFSPG
jgi:ubiquinone/menaquinone biosynthesis C-methylase UbiE